MALPKDQREITQAQDSANKSDDYTLLQRHLLSLQRLEKEYEVIASNLKTKEDEINEELYKIAHAKEQLTYQEDKMSDSQKHLNDITINLHSLPKLRKKAESKKGAYENAKTQLAISRDRYTTIFAGIYDFFVSFVSNNTYYHTYQAAKEELSRKTRDYESSLYQIKSILDEAQDIKFIKEDIELAEQEILTIQAEIKKYESRHSTLDQELTILKSKSKENFSNREALALCIQELQDKYSNLENISTQENEAQPVKLEESDPKIDEKRPNLYR